MRPLCVTIYKKVLEHFFHLTLFAYECFAIIWNLGYFNFGLNTNAKFRDSASEN